MERATPSIQLDLPARVLVSGAAGGIGGAIAARLKAAGSRVIGSDLRQAPPGWDDTPAPLPAGGAPLGDDVGEGPNWITADLGDPAAPAQIAGRVGGRLDGVVMAAGILDPAPWAEIDAAAAQRLLSVNLLAPCFLLQGLASRLNPGASVVLLGSISGTRASPATPLYAASKAALRNLGASLALLLQPQGVRVNVLAPGLIDTPLTDRLNRELAERRGVPLETITAERAQPIPLGRAGTVAETADACLWLLSRQSSYVTGSTIFATGGVMAGSI